MKNLVFLIIIFITFQKHLATNVINLLKYKMIAYLDIIFKKFNPLYIIYR